MTCVPSMPLFCGDYLKDTTDLTLEEHGAYLMILMITWATGGKPLPDDDVRMAKRLSIPKDRWVKRLKPVLAQFFDLSGGTWRNGRLEQEWRYVQDRIAAQRANGAKGGRPPKNEPNGPDFQEASRENFSQNGDANTLENNETTKPNGSSSLNPLESTQPHTSAYAESEEVESVCSVGVNPREAHTQAPPDSLPAKTNVVKFVPASSPEVLPLPDDWTLPNAWYAWAISAGWHDPDGAAEKFANYWLGKKDRGDRDAANSEAGWLRQWKIWINGNLKWMRDHGKQRHGGKQKRGDGLAAFAVAEYGFGSGHPESDSDDGGRFLVRG